MAEATAQAADTTETDAQAASNQASQADATQQQAQAQQTQEEVFDAARAKALIDKLRPFEAQAKQTAKERDQLAARLKDIEDAAKTDAERRQERLDALEKQQQAWAQERQSLLRENAITLHLASAECKDPEWLQDKLAKAELELDEAGKPTSASVTATIADLRKAHPELFGPKAGANGAQAAPTMPSSGSPTNPARTQANSGVFTTTQIRDHAFYKAHEKEILQAQREGRIINQ